MPVTFYSKSAEAYMERLGYIEGKEKRNLEHFEWLVRYQIQEWEIRNIADHYSKKNNVIGEDTIQKVLKNTAVNQRFGYY